MLINIIRKFISRNSKLGLKLEAIQWVKEAKKKAQKYGGIILKIGYKRGRQ